MDTITTGPLPVPTGVYATRPVIAAPPPQQYPQQAPVDASGKTLVLILAIAIVITAWRKSKAVRWPLGAALIAGVLLGGSVFAPMVHQMAGSLGGQMESMVNGFSNGGSAAP